jgi:hypothetical protein
MPKLRSLAALPQFPIHALKEAGKECRGRLEVEESARSLPACDETSGYFQQFIKNNPLGQYDTMAMPSSV